MKIGVVGLGSIGSRHYTNLVSLGHEAIGYDPCFRRDVPFERCIYDDCNAVIVATPSAYHSGGMRASIERARPVFVEKPISLASPEVISSLLEYAKRKNVIVFVGYNLRFHPCVIRAKEWIEAGRIGKPLWANFVCAQYSDKPDYLRDGVILNWSHEIDLALHLLGPAHLEASSTRVVNGQDDMTDILVTHESGCRTSIHLDYVTKMEQRHFFIIGETGRIIVHPPERRIFYYPNDRTHANSELETPEGSYDTDYMDEMKEFIRLIENPGSKTIGCTGKEALKVLDICLQVRKQAGL
jgi:predicted dehydrogenase